mgnify:FL=1|jgi:very-short-patch-repair endonuclease
MDSTYVSVKDILTTSIFKEHMKNESPIESKLLGVLQKFGLAPVSQKQIGPYRTDIYLEMEGLKIVIECDGKEYHQDKSKDDERDKYLLDRGFIVLRFTGSEICKSPQNCAISIISNLPEFSTSDNYLNYLNSINRNV